MHRKIFVVSATSLVIGIVGGITASVWWYEYHLNPCGEGEAKVVECAIVERSFTHWFGL
jgi:hypothetical protein